MQVSTFAPVMCLQPINPAGGAGAAIVQQPCSSGNPRAGLGHRGAGLLMTGLLMPP